MCCYRSRLVFSCWFFKILDISQGSVATFLVGFLVIVLLQIFFWFWQWYNCENWLIFDEVKAYKNHAIFRLFGPPCMSVVILPLFCRPTMHQLSWLGRVSGVLTLSANNHGQCRSTMSVDNDRSCVAVAGLSLGLFVSYLLVRIYATWCNRPMQTK